MVLALTALPLSGMAGPFEELEQEVVQWANSTPAFQGRSMRVAPLDSRITLQNCQQKLQFDQPFPVQPSVRVRCSQPQWQLFVTLTNGVESASPNRVSPAGPALHKVLVSKEMLKRGTLITPSMFVEADAHPRHGEPSDRGPKIASEYGTGARFDTQLASANL